MTCAYCHDTGLVEVLGPEPGTPYGEAYAPCPRCDAGHLLEFPEKGVGAWGREGYWRGRDSSWLEPLPDPLPVARPVALEHMKAILQARGVKEMS